VKLSKVGFGNFLADTRVSRLKAKRDNNKGVYLLIQFVTVLDTSKLIVIEV